MAGGRLLPRARVAALVALVATAASCSDLPMRPLPLVPVRGVIRDRDGATVGYTIVYFTRVEDRAWMDQWPPPPDPVPPVGGRIISDSNGAFSVTLYEGRYDVYLLPPSPSSYGGIGLRDVAITRDHPQLDFAFMGVWVRGHLYGPGNQLLDGGRVYAVRPAGDLPSSSQSAVVRAGRYAMLLSPGTWFFEASPASSASGLPRAVKYGVSVRTDTIIDFTLDGEKVTGTVYGPGGAPLTGATVGAFGTTDVAAITDGTGAFVMFVPLGNYRWAVIPSAGQSYVASREFFASVTGPTSLVFDLSGVTWTGSVRLSGSGEPVAGAQIRVESVTRVGAWASTSTDAVGGFQVVIPPQAIYTVEIYPPVGISRPFTSGYIGAVSDSTLEFVLDPQAPAGPLTTREVRRSWSPGAP